jgi:hypothetical protein
LFVEVGGQVETITFNSLDFASPGAATSQEVLKKINTTADLFESRVTRDGSQIKIFARANTDEQIQVTGGTANTALNFPTDLKETMKLYRIRDNIATLLTKDGITANLDCANPAAYDLSAKQNLAIVVDGKAARPQNVWFLPGDFVTPANVIASQVVDSINEQLQGALAQTSSNDTKVRIISNTKRSTTSQLRVIEKFTKVWHFDGGTYNDRTAAVLTGATLSNSGTDFLYLGHDSVPFETIYASNLTGTGTATWQFWNGSTWQAFSPVDETSGLTVTGHLYFKLPTSWVPNAVNGVTQYWVRATNLNASTGRLRICSANITFGFPTIASLGLDRDYTLNRFIGQIELESTLNPLDGLMIGSFDTRAAAVSATGAYGLVGGEVLNVDIDGVSQVVTFQAGDFFAPGAALPAEVVARINADLSGAVASLVAVGTKVRIQTNKFNGGTLQVTGGDANAFLQFDTALNTSYIPHVPALESVAEPFAFKPDDSVIVVMDGNAANNFTTPCTKESALTGVVSTTSMSDSTLFNTFPTASELVGFDFLYTQEYFVTIQNIRYQSDNADRKLINITYTGGGTAGAEVVTVLGFNISIKIESGVSTANQIKAAFDLSGAATALATAIIPSGGATAQTTVSATYLSAPRSVIQTYSVPSGAFTLSPALPVTPSSGDEYQIAPRTADDVVKFWSNKKIALITTQAEIRASSGGTKVQIASLAAGEEASVQVPGGDGNLVLQYPTSVLLGVDGYRHYTGLAQVTQWVIDGKVDDPDNYQGIRAAGVQVEVADSVTIPIQVQLSVTTQEGITLSAITNDVKSAVASYINNLTVGAEVIVSSIISTVKAVDGVFDVQVNLPTSNIAIAFNELPRIKESEIIVG